jgi:hypothetical protein
MPSDVEICNIALARLGAESIRAFDENHKNARLCQTNYEHVRNVIMEGHDWNFAADYVPLALLAGEAHPRFSIVYALPSGCLYPKDLLDQAGSISSRTQWEMYSNKIATNLENAWLRFTKLEIATGFFPHHFVEAIVSQMAADLAPAVVQDKKLYKDLLGVAIARLTTAQAKDAEVGVDYRTRDESPDKDTFVYPPGQTPTEEEWGAS